MNEKAIAAALEPFADALVKVEQRIAQVSAAKGDKGDRGNDANVDDVAHALAADPAFAARCKGKDGENGTHGIDGVGIEAELWQAGDVYRESTFVVAHLGQYFVALKDTVAVPGESTDWRRIGSGGFRHRGTFDKDAAYVDGDLFVKDFGTFAVINGAHVLFAHRGATGKQGAVGLRGAAGTNGRDGATIIGAQVQGFKLVLVQQASDGAVDHIEADFTAAFRALVGDELAAVRAELAELRKAVA